jgi:hypothetical protein
MKRRDFLKSTSAVLACAVVSPSKLLPKGEPTKTMNIFSNCYFVAPESGLYHIRAALSTGVVGSKVVSCKKGDRIAYFEGMVSMKDTYSGWALV